MSTGDVTAAQHENVAGVAKSILVDAEIAFGMESVNRIAGKMWSPKTWENRLSIAVRFRQFCDKKLAYTRESAAFYLGTRSEALKRSTFLQYAWYLKQMSHLQLSLLDKVMLGLICKAAPEPRN